MMARINPGNLSYRLGVVLSKYEEAIDQGDLERAANHVRTVRTYVGIYMDAAQAKQYDGLPGFSYGDTRTPSKVREDVDARLEFLLKIAQEHNHFARAEAEVGDASALDEEAVEA